MMLLETGMQEEVSDAVKQHIMNNPQIKIQDGFHPEGKWMHFVTAYTMADSCDFQGSGQYFCLLQRAVLYRITFKWLNYFFWHAFQN